MATGSKKQRSSKKASNVVDKNEVPLTVIPEYPADFPSFYSNYASVTHTASEVFIDCCLLAMPYNVNWMLGRWELR